MRSLAAPLMALLLFAPLALAGTEKDPDVPGIPDYSDKTLDFLAAWFESAPDGVVFTVKVTSAEKIPVNKGYIVAFDFQGAHLVAGVVLDDKGKTHSYLGPSNWNANRVGAPSTMEQPLEDVSFTPGTPAYATAKIPFDALPGLGPDKVLIDLYGGTVRYTGTGWTDVDQRSTSNTYLVEKAYLPLAVQRNPAWVVAGFVVLGIAVAGGIVWYRRRSGQ